MAHSSQARNLQPASPVPPRGADGSSQTPVHPQHFREFVRRIASPIDRKHFTRTLVLTVALPCLLLTLTAGALVWAINGLVRADREVQLTGQVIAQSFETMKLILDMETGVRGYLSTGDRAFLEPYGQSRPKVGPSVDRLGLLVIDRPAEREQVDHIRHSVAGWQAFAEDAIQKRSSSVAAGNGIDSARGKELMDEVRDQFSGLVANVEERRTLALISAHQASRFASRLGLLLMLAVTGIIGLFVGYQVISISRTYENALMRVENLSHELAEREAHFRVLAEAIPHIVWTTTPDGAPQYFNQRWFDYVGKDQISSRPWLDRVNPEDRRRASSQWNASLSSGKPFAIETLLCAGDGKFRWHLGRALPLRDDLGTIIRWVGTFTDIDDQKRTEETRSRLAAIVESSEDAIFSKDLDGYITSWNSGAEKMYGYSAGEIVGQHIAKLSPLDHVDEVQDILRRLRRGESIEHVETIRLRKDGRPVEVSLSISPIRTSSGAITGASTIARDVTERNRAAEALRKTEKLAATGRLAGTIAHEINNPLEAITHLLYLIERNPSLDAAAHEYARIAMDEVNRVGHIAKQALGFYREAAVPLDVSIAAVIEDVVQLYAAGAQNKGVTLETQLETRATVAAFPGEIRQVFSNLIVNAVDAVNRGGVVKVRVKHGRDWRSARLGIRVLVADNGPGIPESVRPRVFEPFFTTKGEKGTGVGLWVSEGVLHKHGGSIRVKSSTGAMHGTTFAVFVPYV